MGFRKNCANTGSRKGNDVTVPPGGVTPLRNRVPTQGSAGSVTLLLSRGGGRVTQLRYLARGAA